MPCYDSRDSNDREQLQKRCDKLARMLCRMCEKYEGLVPINFWLNKELKTWWLQHQKLDRKRSKRA